MYLPVLGSVVTDTGLVHPVSGAEDVDGMAGFRKRHRVFNLALKLLF